MRRLHQSESVAQISLPLDLDTAVNPASDSALRSAFKRLQLSHRLSFEQAMSDTSYAIGIRNFSEAIARRLGDRTAASPLAFKPKSH